MTTTLTIARGEKTHTMPMKTPAHFAIGMKSPVLDCSVHSVVTTTDYQHLVKTLATIARPFAIAIVQPK